MLFAQTYTLKLKCNKLLLIFFKGDTSSFQTSLFTFTSWTSILTQSAQTQRKYSHISYTNIGFIYSENEWMYATLFSLSNDFLILTQLGIILLWISKLFNSCSLSVYFGVWSNQIVTKNWVPGSLHTCLSNWPTTFGNISIDALSICAAPVDWLHTVFLVPALGCRRFDHFLDMSSGVNEPWTLDGPGSFKSLRTKQFTILLLKKLKKFKGLGKSTSSLFSTSCVTCLSKLKNDSQVSGDCILSIHNRFFYIFVFKCRLRYTQSTKNSMHVFALINYSTFFPSIFFFSLSYGDLFVSIHLRCVDHNRFLWRSGLSISGANISNEETEISLSLAIYFYKQFLSYYTLLHLYTHSLLRRSLHN